MERFWKLSTPKITVGIDLHDRWSELCVVDASGEVLERGRVRTSEAGFARRFPAAEAEGTRVALEVGTHSPWVSRMLEGRGYEVIVANTARLYGGKAKRRGKKTDAVDAEHLARQARADPGLLYPVRHRGQDTQADRTLIISRDAVVRSRTQLINSVRGSVKAHGARLSKCSANSFARTVRGEIPESVCAAVMPMLELIERLTREIRGYDRLIEEVAERRYPETAQLRQIKGVGALTSLAFVLTIEDPHRFAKSRTVGSYVGLTPRIHESGGAGSGAELRVHKQGDELLRKLLVQAAHYIVDPFGPETDLRRWGLALAARGGKNQKKRATVAVARKLAVLLHRLWVTGEVYEPLRNSGSGGEEEGEGASVDGARARAVA